MNRRSVRLKHRPLFSRSILDNLDPKNLAFFVHIDDDYGIVGGMVGYGILDLFLGGGD
jgi:hypothetical protein